MSGSKLANGHPLDLKSFEEMILACPFHRFLGIELEEIDIELGRLTLSLTAQAEFSRSDERIELHGGIIASLIDIAGDYAVALRTGTGVPTINLRTDYLRLARGTKAFATAQLVRCGRSIATVDIEVRDETGEIVAVGRGTYSSRMKG